MFIRDHKGRAGASIGIAVTTYNRLPLLRQFLSAVREHTSLPFDIAVCDDGSTDGTLEWCAANQVPVFGGINRGIAWNKNRGLYALMTHSSAGTIVLFDDDSFPQSGDWAEVWSEAAERWGHVMAVHPDTAKKLDSAAEADEIRGGAGNAADPFWCDRLSGCVIASSRPALCKVGYFDSRFKGYGHEHAEWTIRFHKLGYGAHLYPELGPKAKSNLMLRHGIGYSDVPTTSDKSTVAANRQIMDVLKSDGIYRLPWRDEDQRTELVGEITKAMRPFE